MYSAYELNGKPKTLNSPTNSTITVIQTKESEMNCSRAPAGRAKTKFRSIILAIGLCLPVATVQAVVWDGLSYDSSYTQGLLGDGVHTITGTTGWVGSWPDYDTFFFQVGSTSAQVSIEGKLSFLNVGTETGYVRWLLYEDAPYAPSQGNIALSDQSLTGQLGPVTGFTDYKFHAGSYGATFPDAGGGWTGEYEFTITVSNSLPVPEPSIIALFAAGLFGMGVARRRRRA